MAAAAAALSLTTVPLVGEPLRRLAGGEGDGPDPQFDVPLNEQALRRAAEEVHVGDTYFADAQTEPPLAQGNLKAAGQLYLARGLPVQDSFGGLYVLRLRDQRITLEARR